MCVDAKARLALRFSTVQTSRTASEMSIFRQSRLSSHAARYRSLERQRQMDERRSLEDHPVSGMVPRMRAEFWLKMNQIALRILYRN